MFSKMKDIKNIEQDFHSVDWVIPQGWDLGVLGFKNFSVGICDCAPSTAGSSYYYYYYYIIIIIVFLQAPHSKTGLLLTAFDLYPS